MPSCLMDLTHIPRVADPFIPNFYVFLNQIHLNGFLLNFFLEHIKTAGGFSPQNLDKTKTAGTLTRGKLSLRFATRNKEDATPPPCIQL